MCSKVGVVLHYCCGMPSSYIPLPFPLERSGRHNIFFLSLTSCFHKNGYFQFTKFSKFLSSGTIAGIGHFGLQYFHYQGYFYYRLERAKT